MDKKPMRFQKEMVWASCAVATAQHAQARWWRFLRRYPKGREDYEKKQFNLWQESNKFYENALHKIQVVEILLGLRPRHFQAYNRLKFQEIVRVRYESYIGGS